MKSAWVVAALFWGVAGGQAEAQTPRSSDRVIWQGQSGGFQWRWTGGDVTAQSGGSEALSVKPLVREGFQRFSAEAEGKCTYERKFVILSIVGSMASLQDTLYSNCVPSAHPAGEQRFTTLDLRRSGAVTYGNSEEEPMQVTRGATTKVVALTDLFAEKDVRKALLADKIIRDGLSGEAPAKLADLPQALDSDGVAVGSNPCHFRLPADFLTRFAFHHIEGNQVAVRLALEPLGGACRNAQAQLGLLLPIPTALQEPLALANSGQQGFLMKDQRKIATAQQTTLTFTINRKATKE